MKSIYYYLFAISIIALGLVHSQVAQTPPVFVGPQCESSNPTAPRVLWINVNFVQYKALSQRGYNLLKTYATADARGKFKGVVDYYNLGPTDNIALDLSVYNQIWFVDFSSLPDNYPNSFNQIVAWSNAKSTVRSQLILDGRFASSFWLPFDGYANDHKSYNPQILYNYYTNLARYDGGIVIGTDHDNYHKTGANGLLSAMGITTGFSGKVFSMVLEVSTTHPLISYPENAGFAYPAAVPKGDTKAHFFVWDDSSTAVAPTGVFANGRFNLQVIARHSDGTPAITSSLSKLKVLSAHSHPVPPPLV